MVGQVAAMRGSANGETYKALRGSCQQINIECHIMSICLGQRLHSALLQSRCDLIVLILRLVRL